MLPDRPMQPAAYGRGCAAHPLNETVIRKPASILILTAEAAVAAYLVFMAWLLSSWMVDESVAFRMTEVDWWLVGARRLGVACIVAISYTLALIIINRRWVAPHFRSNRLVAVAPVLLGSALVAAAAVGAGTFVATKPYM